MKYKYTFFDILIKTLVCSKEDINLDPTYAGAYAGIIRSYAGIIRSLESIEPREKLVLMLRYGQGLTLRETGELLSKPKSRERVRQIEARALRKLSHPSRANILRRHCLKKTE